MVLARMSSEGSAPLGDSGVSVSSLPGPELHPLRELSLSPITVSL